MIKQPKKQNTDKLTEKAFSRLLLTSVLGILLCLGCLCSATWAWYSANTASSDNKLGAGKFDLEVSVTEGASTADGEGQPTVIQVTVGKDGTKSCTLGEAGQYAVVMTMTEDATVSKGYCEIKVNGKTYYTDTVYEKGSDDGESTLTFIIEAKSGGLNVVFHPVWGMSSICDVQDGGILTLP